jgi:hypothetical protein
MCIQRMVSFCCACPLTHCRGKQPPTGLHPQPSRKGSALLALAAVLLCLIGGVRAKDDALYRCAQRCPKADFEFDIEVQVKPTDIGGSPLKYYSRQITGAGSPEDWVLGEQQGGLIVWWGGGGGGWVSANERGGHKSLSSACVPGAHSSACRFLDTCGRACGQGCLARVGASSPPCAVYQLLSLPARSTHPGD